MTRTTLILIATLGSAALLLGAFGFQHLGGLAPCKLCLWQRYPHAIAIALGVLALALPRSGLIGLGALSAATTGGIGAYHVGVEQGWWEGPTTCTAGPIGGLSTDALMDQILNAPLIRCDDIPWELMGVSMAGWNALVSFGLVLIWLAALRAR